jgi:glycosyltransferase involved in cell wall biosynthesis
VPQSSLSIGPSPYPSAVRPRISVVVIAYNAEPYITQTLETVVSQNYPDFEVIVVDDGSTDGTRACVERFGASVKYVHQPNSGGCSKPRNTGIAMATGDLLAFIDSDDLMVPGRLAAEAAVFEQHPEIALVFSDYQDFDASGLRPHGHFSVCPLLVRRLRSVPVAGALVLSPLDSTEILLTENFGSSSPMVRRAAVEVTGGYDEGLRASEDFDFQYRIAARYPIAVRPQTSWHKRLHLASMSSNTPNILSFKILTRRRLLESEHVPRRRRKLKRRLALYHAALAYYYTGRDNTLAWRYATASLALSPRPNLRVFLRLMLDFLGRRTVPEIAGAASR